MDANETNDSHPADAAGVHPASMLAGPMSDAVQRSTCTINAMPLPLLEWLHVGITQDGPRAGITRRQAGALDALTVANKVAVDVQACGFNQTEPAAVAIAGQIAAKLANR
jgi:hypothetical protein